jgi:hypothetical protein
MPKLKKDTPTLTPLPYTLVRSETQLFEEPAYDVTLVSSTASEYHPITSLSDSKAPIEFFVQSNDTQFIDLSETKLYLKAKIVTSDLKNLKEDVIVTFVNNALHSLFSQCSVYLNEVMITPSSNQYAYRSYIETLLGYNKEFHKSQAQCALYFKNKDSTNTDPTKDDGFGKRFQFSKGSKEVELIGRPYSDIFVQNKFLVPGVDMRIQFLRSSPEFCLHATADGKYNVQITEAKLIIQKHTILPSLMTNILKSWEDGALVTYPMKKVEVKAYTLAPGTVQNVNENILTGILPDRIIIGLIRSTDYAGNITTNPFNFQDFGLSFIDVSVNGDKSSSVPIHVDFNADQYIQLYYNLFYALGITNDDCGIEMTRSDFKGSPLMAYNLRHVKDSFTLPRHGSVKIELKFKNGLTEAVTVLVYAEYQSILHIDKNKNIFYKDYSGTTELQTP